MLGYGIIRQKGNSTSHDIRQCKLTYYSVRKVAKALLKKFMTSLLLWNGYAQVEWQDGKVDAARNIFSTALGMSKGFPEVNRRDTILLWRTWAWEEIGDLSQTVRILLSVESGKLLPEGENSFAPKNIQPALLLKSRRVSVSNPLTENY